MSQPRSFKFYRKNEEDVMKSLGLKPTKNSGSGFLEKEDGQNDYVICQLKSTDAQSIRVYQKDIRMLEYNASVVKKIPMFAIQFLNTGEVWLMVKPIDFANVSKYILTGEFERPDGICEVPDVIQNSPIKIVKNDALSRAEFFNDQQKRYEKTKSAK